MQRSHSRLFLHRNLNAGLTFLEVLIAIFIAGLVGVGIAKLSGDVISFNRFFESSFSATDRAQKLLRPMAEEIRSAAQSETGSYSIEIATATNFVFYADIDNDGLIERVRYYLEGTNLKKDVVEPTGNPLSYNLGSAVTTIPISNVQNTALGNVPVFSYYNSSHTGGTTGEVSPGGDVTPIRLVRITLHIDTDLNKAPAATVVTTFVAMRNLKQQL